MGGLCGLPTVFMKEIVKSGNDERNSDIMLVRGKISEGGFYCG